MIDFKTEKFSGPLGLLLNLIQSEEMDVTEISLAKIADEYLSYIQKTQNIDPEELADFLLIAAKLLYIKSKALLPYLTSPEEDEESVDLTRQLRMYKVFLEASLKLKEIIAGQHWLFLPPLSKNRKGQFNLAKFSPPAKLNIDILEKKFLEIIDNLRAQQERSLPEKSLEPKISIDEQILIIKKELDKKIKINFSRMLIKARNRTEIIVSLLAVLELAKRRELIFEQDELFSEINILLQNS